MSKKKQASISDRLQSIEALVEKLESEDIEIEDALQAFEEGVTLIRETQKVLEENQQRVFTLMKAQEELIVEEMHIEENE